MKRLGFISTILFLASLTAFLLGIIYRDNFFLAGNALGTLFFIAGLADLTVMVTRRKATGRI